MKQTRTVIIADDDEDIRKMIGRALKGSSYSVAAEASNGLDLVTLCEEKQPDIVIADIQMPVIDGVEAARQILEADLSRCVIMLTSYDDASYVQASIDAGVIEYLTKPIDLDSLIPTMDGALEKSRELYQKRKELNKLVRRKKSQNLLDTAKLLLMADRSMSEDEAYLFLKNIGKRRKISLEEASRIVIGKMRKTE